MNLIDDAWLPVVRRSGSPHRIAPHAITSEIATDPIVGLDFPRPDFNTALIQFLIGLLQTAVPPENEAGWATLYSRPPDPETLRQAFARWRECFALDGNGPRFMQDLDLIDGTEKQIRELLLEEPGDKTLRDNKDHFLKRGRIEAMAYETTAAALFTLQTNAPSGGVGHRVSLRGGGPLTTLVVPEPESELSSPLWNVLWLNVLVRGPFGQQTGDASLTSTGAIFPWMGPTRTSESKSGVDTTPVDAHPLQMYWAMPRRIRLDFGGAVQGRCSITGQSGRVMTAYQTRNYGINYAGAWRHPLTPYRFDSDGMPIALHPSLGGIAYRLWPALVLGERGGSARATVVSEAMGPVRRRIRTRLWAFGYDMDNMKARAWHEALMPIHHTAPEYEDAFRDTVQDLVECAGMIVGNLRQQLRQAWFSARSKVNGDFGFVEQAYWDDTEPDFYATIAGLHERLEADPDADCGGLLQAWHRTLDQTSIRLFDLWACSGDWEDENPRRIALARRDLRRFNRAKKIRERLMLDAESPV